MRDAKRRRLVLGIVSTDRTFERAEVGGRTAWVGKCLHCNRKLAVSLQGEPLSEATIEHVVPRHHGGTDELENLALACPRCNLQKGWRHDHRRPDHPRTREVIDGLLERRRRRWRSPEGPDEGRSHR